MRFPFFIGLHESKELTSIKYSKDQMEFRTWWNDHDNGSRPWSNISFGNAVKTVTAASSILISDHVVLADSTAAAFTVTLPAAVGIIGKQYIVVNVGTKIVTISTTSSQTISGAASLALPVQYTLAWLMSDGSNWIRLM